MERVPGGHGRVVIVVAVALAAHLWMLNAGMTPADMVPPDGQVPAHPILAAAATPDLPTASHCAVGTSTCLASEPDDRPTAPALALLVVLGGALWTLRQLPPDLHRHRTRLRDQQGPLRPCVPASVVLLQ